MPDERIVEVLKRSTRKLGYHIEMNQNGTRFDLIDDWPGKARHDGDAVAWLTLDQTKAKLASIGKLRPRGK
jgi:hypothetical protein